MKVSIVYFTGTGTTARYAEEIAFGFKRSFWDVTIGDWRKVDSSSLKDSDILGFGCPVYSFYAPRLFLKYLNSLPPLDKPFFLFATCHSMEGAVLWGMYRVLSKKGYTFTGLSCLGFGINNIRAWRPRIGEPPERDELSGLAEAGELAERVMKGLGAGGKEDHVVGKNFPNLAPKPGFLYRLLMPLATWPWEMACVEGFFKRVDRSACTGCGVCYDVLCPAGAVAKGRDGIPLFRPWSCVGCGACVNLCPAGAITTLLNRKRQPFTRFEKYPAGSLK